MLHMKATTTNFLGLESDGTDHQSHKPSFPGYRPGFTGHSQAGKSAPAASTICLPSQQLSPSSGRGERDKSVTQHRVTLPTVPLHSDYL